MRLLTFLLLLTVVGCDSGEAVLPAIGYGRVEVTGGRTMSFEGNATCTVDRLQGTSDQYGFRLHVSRREPLSRVGLVVLAYPEDAAPLPPGSYRLGDPRDGAILTTLTTGSEVLRAQVGTLQIDRVEDGMVAGLLSFDSEPFYDEEGTLVETRVEGTFEAVCLD